MTINVDELADKATMIVEGYAFLPMRDECWGDERWQVVNLYNPARVAVIYRDNIHETNMDDFEISQVMMFYSRNKEFLVDP